MVDLGTARAKARECKEQIDQNIDPLADKRAGKAAKRLGTANTITFGKCAQDYIAEHEPSWKSDKHAPQWHATFEGGIAIPPPPPR